MRAAVYHRTGASDVLQIVERELPQPGPGEVRVRVVRAGVNPTDWKFRASMMTDYDEVTPGQDGAGVVDAVGEPVAGVDGPEVGDRVWLLMAQRGQAYGSAAQYTVQPVAKVIPLPIEASFDLGAALGVPAVTAHRLLTVAEGGPTRLGPGAMDGMKVLVHGGAGAVGHAAIQLARWSGATVITTVSSPEKAALAAAAGAQHTVDYRADDAVAAILAIAPDGVDLILEVAPVPNAELDRAVAKVHGTIAIYANDGGDELVLPVRATFSRNLRYQFVILYTLDPRFLAAAAQDICAAVGSNALSVGEGAGLALHHYRLEDIAAAHDAVAGGVVGKVLIDVAEA